MRLGRWRRRGWRGQLIIRSMLRRGLRPLSVSSCVSELDRATRNFENAERRVMLERRRIMGKDWIRMRGTTT